MDPNSDRDYPPKSPPGPNRVRGIPLYNHVRIAVTGHDESLKAFEKHRAKIVFAKTIYEELSGQYPLESISATMRVVFRHLREERGP